MIKRSPEFYLATSIIITIINTFVFYIDPEPYTTFFLCVGTFSAVVNLICNIHAFYCWEKSLRVKTYDAYLGCYQCPASTGIIWNSLEIIPEENLNLPKLSCGHSESGVYWVEKSEGKTRNVFLPKGGAA